MIQKQKCIVIDIDGTLCPIKTAGESYADLRPYADMVRGFLHHSHDFPQHEDA